MSTVNPTLSFPVFRDIQVCPYSETCRYSHVCQYAGEMIPSGNTVRQLQGVALSMGQGALGAALVLAGLAMSITLFLIPVGLPVALLGVALLSTSSEPVERRGRR